MIFFKRSHNIVASLLFVSLNIIASDANGHAADTHYRRESISTTQSGSSEEEECPFGSPLLIPANSSFGATWTNSNAQMTYERWTKLSSWKRLETQPDYPNDNECDSSSTTETECYRRTPSPLVQDFSEATAAQVRSTSPLPRKPEDSKPTRKRPRSMSISPSLTSDDRHSLQRHNSPASTTHLPGQSSEQRSRSVSPSWASSTVSELQSTDGSTSESEYDWYNSNSG